MVISKQISKQIAKRTPLFPGPCAANFGVNGYIVTEHRQMLTGNTCSTWFANGSFALLTEIVAVLRIRPHGYRIGGFAHWAKLGRVQRSIEPASTLTIDPVMLAALSLEARNK